MRNDKEVWTSTYNRLVFLISDTSIHGNRRNKLKEKLETHIRFGQHFGLCDEEGVPTTG